MHADDLTAILSAFGPKARQQIETLLREYNISDAPPSTPVPDGGAIDESQLSPWLVDRLRPNSRPGDAMTAHARQALRECAARLCPVPCAAEQSAAKKTARLFRRGVLAKERRAS
jgi:hypothetical protein